MYLFLIFYGIFRITSRIFREPDYSNRLLIWDLFSMGTILSIFMIITGFILMNFNEKKMKTNKLNFLKILKFYQ